MHPWNAVQYALKTQGVATISGVLNPEQCAALSLKLATAIANYQPVPGSQRSEQERYNLHDLLLADMAFCQLLDDERLDTELGQMLGEFWTMYAFTSSSLPPHHSNFARRIHVDSPRRVPDYPFNLGVMWALDAFTPDNGAPQFLLGSHHHDDAPPTDHFEAHASPICCAAGDVVIFDARVYHRAGVNTTDHWRHALTMNVCRSYMKQRMDWPRMIPAEFIAQLSPRGQRIVGMHTRVPASLAELNLPQDQRLYRADQG